MRARFGAYVVLVAVELVSVAVLDVWVTVEDVAVTVVSVVVVLVESMHESHSSGHFARVTLAYKGSLQ